MNSTQPEALRLADELEAPLGTIIGAELQRRAAEELRRLYAQRGALLEALRALVQNEGLEPYSYLDKGIGTATAAGQRWLNARATIAAVKGEKG